MYIAHHIFANPNTKAWWICDGAQFFFPQLFFLIMPLQGQDDD
jgi:hypothetical protein